MPSLPVIEQDQVRHAKTSPDGGAFDAPVTDAHAAARADYLMRLGDDALVLGQRLSEWCGHAPALEVDLSLANLALDLIGQATHFLGEAGDADQLAFHRDVLDYKNCLLVEQPNGDFARTIARQWLFSTWQHMLYRALETSRDAAIAGIAAKGVKEVSYHRELAADWVARLGDGTDESAERMAEGLDWCWRFVPELFEVDEVLEGLIVRGIAADPRLFEAEYRAELARVLGEAQLAAPADQRPILGGRRGHHGEHLGHLLAVMQHIPRSFPDATWWRMAEHFHALRVAEIVRETDDAYSIRFAVPDDLAPAFVFRAGQHLTLRADIAGEEVRRNYSLCVAPHEGLVKVTVKRIAGGAFSNWVGDELKPGDVLEVMTPHGSFTTDFDAGQARRYVGFAGGSGITPIVSLIRTALSVEPASRFTLFYGNRDASSVIFLDALADLKDRYMGRFELYHFLSDEAGDVELFNGMLDRATCDAAIEALVDEPMEVDAWFICGPGPMMDAAEAALVERAVAHDRIHIERFTAGRPSAAVAAQIATLQQEAAGLTLAVTLDGRTKKVAFDGANILDSARDAGMPAPFACKAGVCATCRARVTSGKVEMAARYGLTDEEVAAGYVLTCQSVPVGEGVAVDYDA